MKAFHRLSKNSSLTLQEAARQIYAVSDKKDERPKEEPKKVAPYTNSDVMDTKEVVKLLNTLQQTISNQMRLLVLCKAIERDSKQNQDLIEAQKQLAAPKDNSDKIAALPDISGVVSDDDAEPKKDAEQKREEVKEDMHKSQEEMHDEIISKAKENAKSVQLQMFTEL